jgi:HSP20 family protein
LRKELERCHFPNGAAERRSAGWDPFRELDDFRERMSRMLDQTFGGFPEFGREGWSPLIDVEETDDAFLIEADLPGVKREDVDVEVVGNELRINGELQEREQRGVLRQQARMRGRFEYRSTLPQDVDAEQIEATLKDGVLSLRVPKSEHSQPRRVEIKGE